LNADNEAYVMVKLFIDLLSADYALLGLELYSLLAEERAPVQTKLQGLGGVSHDCERSI
jgi:hypothetical protein